MGTEKTILLFGPYKAPALKVGDRSWCLFRNAEVVIYDWTIGPISWPLCYHAETRAFGKGILVEDELARAIRHESAAALGHWWGVCGATVRKWRRAIGIDRTTTEGSRQLIHRTAIGALNARHGRRWGEVRLWTDEELGMMVRLSNSDVARITGRSVEAVAHMRRDLRRRLARA